MSASGIGSAELLLITDATVDDNHVAQILRLAGPGTTREKIMLVGDGRTCTWPLELEVPDWTTIRDVGSHLYHLADYLWRNRETVHAIHALGCNLQLNIRDVMLRPQISLSSTALKRLGDLDIQLELFP
jgi:hypothetical protein